MIRICLIYLTFMYWILYWGVDLLGENFHTSPPSSLTQHYAWLGIIFQSSGLLQCSVWHHDQCCLFLGISVTNTEPESGTGTGKPSLGGGWAVQKRRDFRQIFPLTQLAKPAGTLKFNSLYWINTDFLKDNTQKLNAIMRVRTFVKQNAVSIFDWP